MPRSNRRLRSAVTTVVTAPAPVRRAPPVRPRRRGTRRAAASLSSRNGSGAEFASSYARTLSDPFEYGPVPLGYDCFLPTTMVTAYLRGSFLVNPSDGSFSMYYLPTGGSGSASSNSPVQWQNQTVGTNPISANWGRLDWSNQSQISASIGESRIVSSGLRLFALYPAIDAPGILYAGTAPDLTHDAYQTSSTQTLSQLPGSEIGIGSNGACVTSRPYDNGSYEFFAGNTTGFNNTSVPFHTSGFICGQAFPIGTRIWFEAICHFEGISRSTLGAAGTPSDEVPSASTFFPTAQSLWSGVSSILSSPVVMDAALGALHVAGYGGLARGLGAARRLHGTTQGMFGRGSLTPHFSSMENGIRSTLVIEEMKDQMYSAPQTGRRFI